MEPAATSTATVAAVEGTAAFVEPASTPAPAAAAPAADPDTTDPPTTPAVSPPPPRSCFAF